MERRVVFNNYGQKLFAFKARLCCDEKEIEVYAESCYCPDEARAREDVAFKILDKLLIQTGHSICDFNYRKLCVAQQRIDELERLLEAESKCERLQSELEVYKKHMDF
ncbi:hypothetical protein PIB30_023188 [Stylosanthes scabra]|uniref:Uncharacterized protein n=1 Tax=Stylosanthes scabra TaxID=79078 RepID=A0ABU6U8E0_9FABA|nr:hypothetical protein [Stylosanthes scabra]